MTDTRNSSSGTDSSSVDCSGADVVLESSRAAMLGGWVTRERLNAAAARAGRTAAPLIEALLSDQAPPSFADLARQCAPVVPALHLDASHVVLAPAAARILDMELLRRVRGVPVALLDDLCVLAVVEGRAQTAVRAVRGALHRDVLPVFADPQAIDHALDTLVSPRKAVRRGPLRRHDSPVHARFRALVLEGEILDAIPRKTHGNDRGFARTPDREDGSPDDE